MSWSGLLLRGLPRLLPGRYERLASHLLATAHQRLAKEAAARYPQGRVLDFGTGPGLLALRLAREAPAVRVDGVDVSDHMLLRAEDNVRRARLGERVRLGLLEDETFPWPEQRYDLIVAAFVLHCVPRREEVLQRLHDRLRPGGACWIVEALRDAPISDRAVARLLRAQRVAPSWLPGRWLERGVADVRSRLPTAGELEESVQNSAFGMVQTRSRLPLQAAGQALDGAVLWLETRAPHVVAAAP